jgi:K+/H+ antiporter YhaU regulatory subunit KhtT
MELDSMVVAKLEEEGMSTARFQEIMQSKQNPEGEEIELTTKEEETVANMQSFLQQASMSAQKQQMQSIQESDMSAQRFQSIAQAMQSDKELAMRMQTIAMEMESN